MRQYVSERITDLAIAVLKQQLVKQGLANDMLDSNSNTLRALVLTADIKTVVKKTTEYSSIKHVTVYGNLEKGVQDKLNLILALFDLSGKSTAEKSEYINRTIKKYEANYKKKDQIIIQQQFIKDLSKNILGTHERLDFFLRKVDNLYTIQMSKLNRKINDSDSLDNAKKLLEDCYSKSIQEAISLLSHWKT